MTDNSHQDQTDCENCVGKTHMSENVAADVLCISVAHVGLTGLPSRLYYELQREKPPKKHKNLGPGLTIGQSLR